nr:DUF1491 family protein [Aestuariivirga litoralis]
MRRQVSANIKSRIWVEALLRRCQAEGKFGAVVHSGADEAGAVFVAINHLDGTYDLLAPPVGPAHSDYGERLFTQVFEQPQPWAELAPYIERQRKFDSDLWLVEIEDKQGLAGLKPASF